MKYEFYFKLQVIRKNENRPFVHTVPHPFKIMMFPWAILRGGYAVKEILLCDNLIKM